MSLEGRRALVTGATGGIGRAIAHSLAREGARIVVSGRSRDALDKLRDALGDGAEAIVADLEAEGGPRSLAQACAEGGAIEILVNNAGIAEGAPIGRTSDAAWERALRLNATAPFQLCRELLPEMRARGTGRIINVASTAGLSGAPYTSAYCASKHALVGLTRALAAEIGDEGVTVNALCPGWVDTDMAARAIENIARATGRSEGDARAELERANAQRRLLDPEEVARAALWLCDEASRGVHGHAVAIDGGGLLR